MKLRKVEIIAREMMNDYELYNYRFEWMKSVRTFGNCNGAKKVIKLSIPPNRLGKHCVKIKIITLVNK